MLGRPPRIVLHLHEPDADVVVHAILLPRHGINHNGVRVRRVGGRVHRTLGEPSTGALLGSSTGGVRGRGRRAEEGPLLSAEGILTPLLKLGCKVLAHAAKETAAERVGLAAAVSTTVPALAGAGSRWDLDTCLNHVRGIRERPHDGGGHIDGVELAGDGLGVREVDLTREVWWVSDQRRLGRRLSKVSGGEGGGEKRREEESGEDGG